MRKSHRQKVADRRKKRQRRGRQRFYDGLVAKFTRQLKEMQASPLAFAKMFSPPETIRVVLSEAQSAHLLDQARRMDEVIQSCVPKEGEGERILILHKDAAENAFIGPIINTVPDYEVIGVDPGKAGQDFISALFSAVKADLPAMILSSTESMKPCLLERVLDCRERDWMRRHKINTNPSAEPTEKGE